MKSHWWQCIGLILVLFVAGPVRSQDVLGDGVDPVDQGEAEDAQPDDFDGFGLLSQPEGPSEEQQAEIDRLNASGLQKAQQGDIEGALTDFENALQIAPNFRSFLEFGRLLREEGALTRAIQALGSALQQIRTLPEEQFAASATEAYKELGLAYLDAQEFNNAIQTFQQAQLIQGQRRNAELIYNQGLAQSEFALTQQFTTAQARAEDLQTAIELFDRAIEIRPDYAEALYERGNTYSVLGTLDEAYDDLQRAVELDPENPEWAAQFGYVGLRRALTEGQRRNGKRAQIKADLTTAIEQFGKFLELVPEDPEAAEELELDINRENALISRSAAFIALADEESGEARGQLYQRAITDANAALEIVPDLPDAHFQRGMAFRMMNHLEEAASAYTQALQANPGSTEGLLRRGIVFFRQGELELAKADFIRAIRYSTDANTRAQFWLGLTFSQQGNDVRAVHHYNLAIRYQTIFPLAYLNRGLAHMRMGRFSRAIDDFTEVLRQEPENQQARSLRDRAMQLMQSS